MNEAMWRDEAFFLWRLIVRRPYFLSHHKMPKHGQISLSFESLSFLSHDLTYLTMFLRFPSSFFADMQMITTNASFLCKRKQIV